MRLTLFFTQGISLQTWINIGIFEREVALYRQLQAKSLKISFITYGNSQDLRYQERLPGIKILCNRWRLPQPIYERWLPLLHAPWLGSCTVIKTNQTNGAEVALRAARLWRKPLIARCGYMWSEFMANEHGPTSKAAIIAQEIEATVFNFARQIVVTTPAMAATIARRFPTAALRTRVIPNYVDVNCFQPEVNRQQDFDLVFVGRLSAQKNVAALLEAIQPLNIRTLIIGTGQNEAELHHRFAHLNGQTQWLGHVPNPDLPRYLNRARIFILPSLYEGHPKALLEAMACGLPVIGANTPGIQELIQHGENGWLCATDPESIRTAIQELLAQSELQAKLGRNARNFVVENFTLERILDMELTLLQEVANFSRTNRLQLGTN